MENSNFRKTLVLHNKLDELLKISSFLDELADMWDLPFQLVLSLNLVLEEAFTNIVNYAYPDSGDHFIEITFERDVNEVVITLADDGIPYDPTLREDPDVTLPPEEREIGGLGIYLIKKMMDKVSYLRVSNRNLLTLSKTIGETDE